MSTATIELGKFFTIAGRRLAAGQSIQMFSPAVDAAWHEMAGTDAFPAFSIEHAGQVLAHVEDAGEGLIEWVSAYEEAYGPLPEVWFTGTDGRVDDDALAAYRESGAVWASWKCGPEAAPTPDEPAAGE